MDAIKPLWTFFFTLCQNIPGMLKYISSKKKIENRRCHIFWQMNINYDGSSYWTDFLASKGCTLFYRQPAIEHGRRSTITHFSQWRERSEHMLASSILALLLREESERKGCEESERKGSDCDCVLWSFGDFVDLFVTHD